MQVKTAASQEIFDFSADHGKVQIDGALGFTNFATIADPGSNGAIPVASSGVCPIVTAAAETRTLAEPAAAGVFLNIYFYTDGGTLSVDAGATTLNLTGNDLAVSTTAGSSIALLSIQTAATTYSWQTIAIDGFTRSTP